MCAPNLRVGQDDLRPAALSVHVLLAAIFRLLHALEKNGNAQLTWDDTINYDHVRPLLQPRMRLCCLMFHEEGNRLHDATLAERKQAPIQLVGP